MLQQRKKFSEKFLTLFAHRERTVLDAIQHSLHESERKIYEFETSQQKQKLKLPLVEEECECGEIKIVSSF